MRMLRMASVLCAGMATAPGRACIARRIHVGGVKPRQLHRQPGVHTGPLRSVPRLTHIGYLGGQPVALFANRDLPFGTLSDL